MAERCEAQFDYIMAERHYRSALAILEKQKADAFPTYAAVARALSALYLRTDRLSLARWYARRAMRICRAELHPMHPESMLIYIRCLPDTLTETIFVNNTTTTFTSLSIERNGSSDHRIQAYSN